MLYSLATVALLWAGQAIAHPVRSSGQLQRRIVDLNQFRLKTQASYTNSDDTASLVGSLAKRADYVDAATALVKQVAPKAEFRLVPDHYVGTNGVAHITFKQTANGLDIDNADFNVNVKDGSVFSYGNSFFDGAVPTENPLAKRDTVDATQALQAVTEILQLPVSAGQAIAEPQGNQVYKIRKTSGAHQDPNAKLVYFQNPDKTLTLAWRVETDLADNWMQSYIDATTNKDILAVADFFADASYEVFPWGVNDPDVGSRTTVTDPWDIKASIFTWQGTGTTTYNTTRGNNGIAQENWNGTSTYLEKYRPTAPDANFVYEADLTQTDWHQYVDASITQLFYTANMYHDLLYELGFTEAAGNFEENVSTLGGQGNDQVILNAQDASGTNNARFGTPPDGQNGRMYMYMWTTATPRRDGVFEAGVVIHEYTHGLSNRLTGGPDNTKCLGGTESGGMGEGWGDFMATAIRTKSTDTRATDYPMGAWVYNNPKGIRAYVYSTSLTTNPLTYSKVNGMTAVHAIGTVWATMLYEVLWNLIEAHGNTDAIRPTFDSNGVPTDGRFLAMKLVVDGLALQPCNPNFINARDAILDADKNLTGGENACAIWKGFAKRGLGEGAAYNTGGSSRVEDTTVPAGVC